MKWIPLLTFFFFSFTTIHDVPIATFKIYRVQNQMLLEINFDTVSICKVLEVTSSELSQNLLQKYIDDHTYFIFDSSHSKVKIKNITLQGDHLILESILENAPKTYTTISIQNTCLLSVPNHTNNIILETDSNKIRGFKMNIDRTKITIE